MGILLEKCPSCYSDNRSRLVQCKDCEHVYCNECKDGGGMFSSTRCPKCGSKRRRTVGRIK